MYYLFKQLTKMKMNSLEDSIAWQYVRETKWIVIRCNRELIQTIFTRKLDKMARFNFTVKINLGQFWKMKTLGRRVNSAHVRTVISRCGNMIKSIDSLMGGNYCSLVCHWLNQLNRCDDSYTTRVTSNEQQNKQNRYFWSYLSSAIIR